MRAPWEVLERLQAVVLVETLVFMAFAAGLTLLVATNLTRPLKEIIAVLREVSHGIFDRKIRVTSNDEIGYAGDVISVAEFYICLTLFIALNKHS